MLYQPRFSKSHFSDVVCKHGTINFLFSKLALTVTTYESIKRGQPIIFRLLIITQEPRAGETVFTVKEGRLGFVVLGACSLDAVVIVIESLRMVKGE